MVRLEKTSIQLPAEVLPFLDKWPGVSRSEAIRLCIERMLYFSSMRPEHIYTLSEHFQPILSEALEGMDYKDFRTVARALPAIVAGYVQELDGASWSSRGGSDLNPAELVKELEQLHPLERVVLFDCVVAQRYRVGLPEPEVPTPPSAKG